MHENRLKASSMRRRVAAIGLICGRDESDGWVRGGTAGGYRIDLR